MQLHCFTFNAFQENSYIVWDDSGECAVIDPGCYDAAEKQELSAFIADNKLTVKLLLNTNCHIDHVLVNDFVKEKFVAPFLIHPHDEPVLRSVKAYAPTYGYTQYREALPDGWLTEGRPVSFGLTQLDVLFLPGHSPGHVGFYHAAGETLLAGDVLFRGSIGRTDLPGGGFDTLIQSIHQNLFVLPDTVMVYPGHGPATHLGDEKVSNPFCALKLFS